MSTSGASSASPKLPMPPASDQRGDTLSTLIIFPFIFILILLVLQIWAVSTARTTAQIAADQAVRAAQQSPIPATLNAANLEATQNQIASDGLSAALEELNNSATFIRSERGYKFCDDNLVSGEETASYRSVFPESAGACPKLEPQQQPTYSPDAIATVVVDNDIITANVNVVVSAPLRRFSLTDNQVSSTSCGSVAFGVWSPLRAFGSAEVSIDDDTWGLGLTCAFEDTR